MENKSSTHPVPQKQLNLLTAEMLNPDGIRPVYSNNVAVLTSPHEFRLLFSEIVMHSPTGQPAVELRANISIAPTQFKAFVGAVAQTLENFEKQHGEIKWPPAQPTTK